MKTRSKRAFSVVCITITLFGLMSMAVHAGGDNKTAEEPNKNHVIHFAAASDQHYGHLAQTDGLPSYDDDTMDDWMHHPDLPELDFVIPSMGDLLATGIDPEQTCSSAAEYNADHQKIPYFWVFGNHDITNYGHMTDGNPVKKERLARDITGMNENNYAFMYDNILFICAAQTNCLYTLSGFQRTWIEHLVDRYSDHKTVILTHQATKDTTGDPVGDTPTGTDPSTSWTSSDYRYHNDELWWQELFDKNDQIVLYVHGHNHKGIYTTAHDLHPEKWDDDCLFVMVPTNTERDDMTHPICAEWMQTQKGWSYIFTIANDHISIRLWDSVTHSYISDNNHPDDDGKPIGVPYTRIGMKNKVKNKGMEWFSIPKRVLDGQSWEWKNHMMAKNYRLELVGSDQTEQIDNPDLDGCHESDEKHGQLGAYWYAVDGDENALNSDTGQSDGYIKIYGFNMLELATSPTIPGGHIEGKVPYNTAIAVPGKTYEFSCRIKTIRGSGKVDFLITIPKYLDLGDFVWEEHPIMINMPVDTTYKTYSRTFTVPDDDSAWFIKPHIHFDRRALYILDSWSLKMVGNDVITQDFAVEFNGERFGATGALEPDEVKTFWLKRTLMDNTLHFSCDIDGNRVGILRLIYDKPQLWSDDVTFDVLSEDQNLINIEDRSPYNNRTTVMTFENSNWAIEGFEQKIVRGKYFYYNSASDASINGVYQVYNERDINGNPFNL